MIRTSPRLRCSTLLPTFLLSALTLLPLSSRAATYTWDINYQGYLKDAGAPADGIYDFEFRLFDAPTGGAPFGSPSLADDVVVQKGLFNAPLDFQIYLDDMDMFLEISVRPGSATGAYTVLNGRVPLQYVPRAHYAITAGGARDAQMLDGVEASQYSRTTHTHSTLAAADGTPTNALSADNDGKVTVTSGLVGLPSGLTVNSTSGDNLTLSSQISVANLTFQPSTSVSITAKPGLANGIFAIAPATRTSDGNGHAMYLSGGDGADVGSGDGGTLNLSGGRAAGSGGQGSTGGNGGTVAITAGNAFGTGNNSGGAVTLAAGTATGTGANGTVTIRTANSPSSGSLPADVSLVAGNAFPSGTGAGGDIGLQAGDGAGIISGSGGSGGDVVLAAGRGYGTSASPGGDVILSPGAGAPTGSAGHVYVTRRLAVHRASAPQHPIHVGTGTANGNGAHVTNGGVWTNGSDVHSKTAFEELDNQDILARVLALPITRWQYQGEPPHVRHIGPMAQDFMAAFQLGESDRHIGTVDADGVALAAIKGLHEQTDERLQKLEAENAQLRAQLAAMQATLNQLVAREQEK